MSHVRVNARAKLDNTGAYITVPVILYEQNGHLTVLEPLVRYFEEHYLGRSRSWMVMVSQAVGLLLDYMDANHDCFESPSELFLSFARAVTVGTIGDDGRDPSGLYWIPKLTKGANGYLRALSGFSDWMVKKKYVSTPLNPWRSASNYEQRLNWAALMHKNEQAFLGHLNNMAGLNSVAMQARETVLRRPEVADSSGARTFPSKYEFPLLQYGFLRRGKENSKDLVDAYDWRGICIALLLLGGARRVSEPFHLWVCDVIENPDPQRRGEALVRFYHPVTGRPPTDVLAADGQPYPTREGYLQVRYPGYPPRNKGNGNYAAGWKGLKLDSRESQFFQIKWLPREYGEWFLVAFNMYMEQRLRLRIGTDKHPFLFVSTHSTSFGEPYTIDAFEGAWERAMSRIGLRVSKELGTSLHGPRHAYGKKAKQTGVTRIGLKSGMGHRSEESQDVYGEPTVDEVTREMDEASEKIYRIDSSGRDITNHGSMPSWVNQESDSTR